MSNYEVGKDVKDLEKRVEAIENLIGNDINLGDAEPIRADLLSEVEVDEKAGIAVASKTFKWDNPDRLGNCELRGGYTLTIFSDGRYRAIGTRKCNAGGINSCKRFVVSVALYRGSCSSNPPEVARFNVKQGLLGGGSEGSFQGDGRDNVIRDLYGEIRCAAMWVSRCRTGI